MVYLNFSGYFKNLNNKFIKVQTMLYFEIYVNFKLMFILLCKYAVLTDTLQTMWICVVDIVSPM